MGKFIKKHTLNKDVDKKIFMHIIINPVLQRLLES